MTDTTPTFDTAANTPPDRATHLDYTILTILCADDGDPIGSLTRFQKLLYIAHVGGLTNDDTVDCPAIRTTFEFTNGTNGPTAALITKRLTFLETIGYITTTTYPSQHYGTRTEYAPTDNAHDILNTSDSPLTDSERTTLKTVKTTYENAHKNRLAELTKQDYETRTDTNSW